MNPDMATAIAILDANCSHWEVSKSPNVQNEYRMSCKANDAVAFGKVGYRRKGESLAEMATRCVEWSMSAEPRKWEVREDAE